MPLKETVGDDLADVTLNFNAGKFSNKSPFENSGVMVNGVAYTSKSKPNYEGSFKTLGDVLVSPKFVDDVFILTPESLLKQKGWI